MILSVKKNINLLKKDRTHGAGYLTRQAMELIRLAILESRSKTAVKLIENLDAVVDALAGSKPGMVSIFNYVTWFLDELKNISASAGTIAQLKERGLSLIDSMIKNIEKTSTNSARNASKIVCNRNIIMTCSYSSSVCETLELARKKGIDFKVLATESNVNDLAYGRLTADSLGKYGINTKLIGDDHIRWHIARADVVLVGADAVSLHGWMVNGTPTFELVTIAAQRKIPVFAVCQLSKFDVRGKLTGLSELEEGFNRIPMELFNGIITESGVYTYDTIPGLTLEDIFRNCHARYH